MRNKRFGLLFASFAINFGVIVGTAAVLGLAARPARSVAALTIAVNSTADVVDVNPGDGLCETSTPGECTLRAAVQEANATAGPDIVVLPSGVYSLTIPGANENAAASGDLDLTDSLVISGTASISTIIDGNALDRALHIVNIGVTLTLSDVTVRNGAAAGSGGGIFNIGTLILGGSAVISNTADAGGGIYNGPTGTVIATDSAIIGNAALPDRGSGGGVRNDGAMFATGTSVSGNSAEGGGGIRSSGTLSITNSTIESNSGGGIDSTGSLEISGSRLADNSVSGDFGGAVRSSGAMTVTNTSFVGNAAEFGAGILNFGPASIGKSSFISNTAIRAGGGIYNSIDGLLVLREILAAGNTAQNSGGGVRNDGTLTVTRSSFSGHTADTGAAIYSFFGTLSMTNTTLSGNAANGDGAGLYHKSGTAELNNVTITGNTADQDSDGSGDGGGVYSVDGTVRVRNSIIAGNSDLSAGTIHPDCSGGPGDIISDGHNLVGDETGCSWLDATGDRVGNAGSPIDPRLGPLADNGGGTLTHGLLDGSPAIEAGNPAVPGSGEDACADTDQRGYSRPQASLCDMGAFEGVPLGDLSIEGPATGLALISYDFAAAVSPITATMPVTYVWQATDQQIVIHTGGLSDTVVYAWTVPGLKSILVVATNPINSITATASISISGISSSASLPIVRRSFP